MLVAALRTHAHFRADETATIEPERVVSWRELAERVSRIAGGLCDGGVSPGDRVGILALNSGRFLEAQLAIWWAGAAVVPMNTRLSVEEHAYSIGDSGMSALIVDEHFLEVGRAAARPGFDARLLILGETANDVVGLDDLAATCAAMPYTETASGSLAGIYYTGGTTGAPKGVMLSHGAIWAAAITLAVPTQMSSGSVVLRAAPMFHLADGAVGHAALLVGASNSFVPRFDAAEVLAAVERDRVTMTLLVPTMIGMIVANPGFSPARLVSLRTLCFGASPITASLLDELRAALPDLRLVHCYGQTEMGPLVSYLDPTFQIPGGPKSSSIGRPFPSVEVRIVDGNGTDVTSGMPGEILARGPSMMSGYWNKPAATAETIVDGWIRTGDIATVDMDGFMFIHDRAKDMIITGGENVFSAEVENAVATHPAVAQVAVIGIPDEQYGERVHAVIVPRPGLSVTPDELFEHCRPAIANYKCPRSMELRDSLPISGAGKVLKRDLREPHWAGRERAIN